MPVLYLTEQGATLRKEGDLLLITKEGLELQKVPAIKVEQVVVLGNINLTTPAITYLLENGIDCVFCNSYGKYHGRLVSTESKFGLLRQRQLEAAADPVSKVAIARGMVRGKLLNQRTLLLRYRREKALPSLDRAISALDEALAKLGSVTEVGSLQGIEGAAAAAYFAAFRDLLQQDLGFTARRRRPPPDPVNSLLSFGYTLLVYSMQSAVHTVGLDPFLGFLHSTEYSRPSLVLDLIEEFRAIIVDSVVLRLINTRAMTETDFEKPPQPGGMVLLSQNAIKKLLGHFEERVQTEIQHAASGQQVPYRRCFELQARQLARVLQGQEPTYQPFLVK